jgi:hypothetical protein
MAVGIYGAFSSHRIAWGAYLVFSVAGLVLAGAMTPIVALWLALKLYVGPPRRTLFGVALHQCSSR